LGAFFVPEPLGVCLILAAAIWWLCRRPFRDAKFSIKFDALPQASDWRIDFYRFRAGQNAAILLLLPNGTDYSAMERPAGIAQPASACALPSRGPERSHPTFATRLSPPAAAASDQQPIALLARG
jgi:hypothetical protein